MILVVFVVLLLVVLVVGLAVVDSPGRGVAVRSVRGKVFPIGPAGDGARIDVDVSNRTGTLHLQPLVHTNPL